MRNYVVERGGEERRAEVCVPWVSLPQFPRSPGVRTSGLSVGWQWADKRHVIRNWVIPAVVLTSPSILSENCPLLSFLTEPSSFIIRASESASESCLIPNINSSSGKHPRGLGWKPDLLTYLCVGFVVQTTFTSRILLFPVRPLPLPL